jgi:hypothetical protein
MMNFVPMAQKICAGAYSDHYTIINSLHKTADTYTHGPSYLDQSALLPLSLIRYMYRTWFINIVLLNISVFLFW